MYSNKSISPVVATALLLVVAVVAVIGFQTWYQTYSSSILSNIEKNKLPNNIKVDGVFNDNLYLTSSREDTLTLFKIEDLNGTTMCEYDSKNKEYFNNTKLILSLNKKTYDGTSVIDIDNNINSIVNGATQENNCISKECFYFDNSNSNYILTPLRTNILYAKEDLSWSLSTWFKTNTDGADAIIARGGGTGSGTTFAFYFNGGLLKIRIRGGTVNELGFGYNDNSWHFTTITWDGENAYAYIDDNFSMELEVGSESEQTSQYFTLGAANSGLGTHYYGYIDEVAYYENIALNKNEVNALYNLRKAVPYEEILTSGVRKINISNCNLIPNQEYTFVGFTDTQTIEQSFTVN